MKCKDTCTAKCASTQNIKVGQKVPNFSTSFVTEKNEISKFFLSEMLEEYNMIVLVFYPANFTFVCPTELIALNNRIAEFENRNVGVFAISTDSVFSHLQWKKMSLAEGGIGNIDIPLISDQSHTISKMFDVFDEEESIAKRGTFIIDQNSVLRHMSCNDMGIGREFNEVIRLIDSIHHHDKFGEVCPAGWNKASKKESFKQDTEAVINFLQNQSDSL